MTIPQEYVERIVTGMGKRWLTFARKVT